MRFARFPGFRISYVSFCVHCMNFFFHYPFFTASRLWRVISFKVYTWKCFIAVQAVMSHCTAMTTGESSSTRCFRVTKMLWFKAVQRLWNVWSFTALKISCFYGSVKFWRVYCEINMLCKYFIIVSDYCHSMDICYTLIFKVFQHFWFRHTL